MGSICTYSSKKKGPAQNLFTFEWLSRSDLNHNFALFLGIATNRESCRARRSHHLPLHHPQDPRGTRQQHNQGDNFFIVWGMRQILQKKLFGGPIFSAQFGNSGLLEKNSKPKLILPLFRRSFTRESGSPVVSGAAL